MQSSLNCTFLNKTVYGPLVLALSVVESILTFALATGIDLGSNNLLTIISGV
jgi:hypothetical protein